MIAIDVQPNFLRVLSEYGCTDFRRGAVTTLQINVGKVCNQACLHCHVEAGPKRTESMSRQTAERILWLLERSRGIEVVDITGGAPEINPSFRLLAQMATGDHRRVIDRCNLTILFEPGHQDLPEFLAAHRVDIVASLPCYTAENVDGQRGRGVFGKSIRALQLLNNIGYGKQDSGLRLDLVYNPLGPSLPPPQARLEAEYKRQLREHFGVEFHRLLTITNMPISRFADALAREGKTAEYGELLVRHFNPSTVNDVMCRSLVSVGWDGGLYDCDFNQMLSLRVSSRRTIWNIESFDELADQPITTGRHCFGCTAGAGSSCGGQLE